MKTKKQSQNLTEIATGTGTHSIGIDLGDRFSQFCILDADGEVIEEGRLRTSQEAIRARFERISVLRIAMEAGTHSGWVSRLLEELGHEVVVANPRDVFGIIHSNNKNESDRRGEVSALRSRRSETAQSDHTQERGAATGSRHYPDAGEVRCCQDMLINAARGIVKSLGHRLPGCGADYFADQCWGAVPPRLKAVIDPLLHQIASLTKRIDIRRTREDTEVSSWHPSSKLTSFDI
jgi:transposase